MRRAAENPEAGGAGAPWTRGAVVSLWLVASALVAGTLALRWDAIIARLAAAPSVETGGNER